MEEYDFQKRFRGAHGLDDKSLPGGNHPPVAILIILIIHGAKRRGLALDASSTDPDGDQREFVLVPIRRGGTYKGAITIKTLKYCLTSIGRPKVASAETVHFILKSRTRQPRIIAVTGGSS